MIGRSPPPEDSGPAATSESARIGAASDKEDGLTSRRAGLGLAALGLACALLFLAGLGSGSVPIPPAEALRGLFGHPVADPAVRDILWQLRLPRCLTAALAGAALSAAGLLMQTLFRNPLAGPYSLGISAGATLGVALAMLAGSGAASGTGGMGGMGGAGAVGSSGLGGGAGFAVWAGQLGTAGSAVAGAAAVMLLVLAAARRIRSHTTLLILGLMFGQAAGALVSVLQSFSDSERLRAFAFWGFGSYAGVTWAQLPALAAATALGLAIAGACAKPLNALLLGWTYARSLGVRADRLRIALLAATSLLAGAVTAFCGPVAFLGLAAPHLCRGLFRTADHRVLLPACVLLGAALSLAADLAARLPGGGRTLPLNAVMALIGAPVVVAILVRRRAGGDE